MSRPIWRGLLPAEGGSATITISLVTLAVTVFGSVLFRGFLIIIPILVGIIAGYALSFAMGIVDWTLVYNAPWFALPTFYTPRFEWAASSACRAGGDRRARRASGGHREYREKRFDPRSRPAPLDVRQRPFHIIGVSGAKVHIGAAELKGMALATLIFRDISLLRPEGVGLEADEKDAH